MFTKKELGAVDTDYFSVFEKTPLYVRIQSKNTRHYWRIFCPGMGEKKSKCLVQHAHGVYDGFHVHGYENSLAAAIKSIKAHDKYQMTHRKRVIPRWDEYAPLPPLNEV